MLSNAEKALLSELSMNPMWQKLLDSANEIHGRVPAWKPGNKTEDEKAAEWIYRSGVEKGASGVLELLGYERNSQNR